MYAAIFSVLSFCVVTALAKPQAVTCGSVVKLMNNVHKIRLHSHDVKYGSGSGQQSVTGVHDKEDVNSHWTIKGPEDKNKDCKRSLGGTYWMHHARRSNLTIVSNLGRSPSHFRVAAVEGVG